MKTFWQRYGYWIKVVVSVTLLVVLVLKVDVRQVAASIALLPWWYLPLAAVMYVAAQSIAAVRWWLMSPGTSLRRLMYVTFSTQHLVFLVPSSFTTDVVRVVEARGGADDSMSRMAGVLIDKVIGLCVLAILFGISVLVDTSGLIPNAVSTELAAVSVVAGAIPLGLMLMRWNESVVRRFEHLGDRIIPKGFRSWLGASSGLGDALRLTIGSTNRVVTSSILAVLAQMLSASTYVLYGAAFGFTITYEQCLLLSTLAQIVALVPLGIAGIGVRDYSLVALLGLIGVSTGTALAASLSGYPVMVGFALAAWVMVVVTRNSHVPN